MESKASAQAHGQKLLGMGAPAEVIKAAQSKGIPLATIWAIAQALLSVLPEVEAVWAKILEIINNHPNPMP